MQVKRLSFARKFLGGKDKYLSSYNYWLPKLNRILIGILAFVYVEWLEQKPKETWEMSTLAVGVSNLHS